MNFRTLDLNLLRVFDAVMVERNVTRASARLAMTQPAVSNALRRLRDATGEDLFVPSSTGMTPTAHANAMWPAVRQAMEALRVVFDRQEFDPARDERCFTVCTADATAAVLMPGLIDALGREAPRVDLRVVPLTTRDPRAQLEQGFADVAIGFFPEVTPQLSAQGDASVIAIEDLYRCEYVCVMRRAHPLAQQDTLTLDEYCAAQHIRVSFAGRPRGFVDEALARLGRERRVKSTVNQFSTAAHVAHKTDLLTVLPRSFVAATGFADDLVMRPFPCPLPRIEVAMLWHRREPAQRWFRDFVTRIAPTLPRGGEPRKVAKAGAAPQR
jgi:DNA-binding transcriptional LysR family regulator